MNIINAGTNGLGTTEIANHDLATGTDLAVGVEVEFTIATAPLAVSEGTKIQLQEEKVGAGVLVGSGTWILLIDGVN